MLEKAVWSWYNGLPQVPASSSKKVVNHTTSSNASSDTTQDQKYDKWMASIMKDLNEDNARKAKKGSKDAK